MEKDLGKLILRIGTAGLLLPHGISKLERLFAGNGEITFADPFLVGQLPTLILAVLAEAVCPLLIIIGWKVRWMCILPIITMATAAFVIHIDDPWGKMELPLLFLTGFLAVALLGPGRWSVDPK